MFSTAKIKFRFETQNLEIRFFPGSTRIEPKVKKIGSDKVKLASWSGTRNLDPHLDFAIPTYDSEATFLFSKVKHEDSKGHETISN